MKIDSNLRNICILIILSAILFMFGNGMVNLTNPDEVFYAQTAKEMAQQKTWLVPYLFGHPQFEKPILTYWLIRTGFILFGVSNFGARFFPAVFAVIGLIAVYILALLGFKNKQKAFICALILMSSGLYIGLAKTLFTDMIFSVLILLSLTAFFWGYVDVTRKAPGIQLSFIFSGLAVLTKGPLGFLIPLLTILLFLALRKELRFIFCRYSLWGFLLFLLITFPWYVFIIRKFGSSFIHEFFYNDHIRRLLEAEHPENDNWHFYPASMIGCIFPWSIYLVISFFYLLKRLRTKGLNPAYLFLSSWILVVFVIFQSAHSKLVSYIFPLFGALAIITGDFIYDAKDSPVQRRLMLSSIAWITLLVLPAGLFAIGMTKYSMYLSSKNVIYNSVFLYIILVIIILFFAIKRNKFSVNIYLLAFYLPSFLFFLLPILKNANPYLSSRDACTYLLKNYRIENTILCSKTTVRGVRFFTDKDVAVFYTGGGRFFSPHPIPFLDSDEQVRDFLAAQKTTFCIIKKSALPDMERVTRGTQFKFEVLKIIGNDCIVRVAAA